MDTFTITITNTTDYSINEFELMNMTLDELHCNNINNINNIKYFMNSTTITLVFWINIVILLFWYCVYLYDTYQERQLYTNRQRLG